MAAVYEIGFVDPARSPLELRCQRAVRSLIRFKRLPRCLLYASNRMAGSMPQVSEGYRLGSCWIPIRPSHDSISDCHILAQLRGLPLQNGGSIPLRRQKDFRS